MPPAHAPLTVSRSALALALAAAWATVPPGGRAAVIEDSCDGPQPAWSLAAADTAPRVLAHERSAAAARRGTAGERFVIDAAAGTTLTVEVPIGNAEVIDELAAEAWVRSNRPDIRIAAKVQLPQFHL